MAGRLANRQRQLSEQGRLRLGTHDGSRPIRSSTWILSSHSEEHIRAAAALWGGEAQRWQPQGNGAEQWRVITKTNVLDAVLPPGDPLTQAYEQWNRGGCVRRCNGITEELSGSPCICRAQFGEKYHEQKKGTVCDDKTRLKVILPDMPGLGTWRMETGSWYAADEIAGLVDLILGSVGEQVLVPVRLRIEERTRVAGGKTKQFVVPVVELRGSASAGQLLAGTAEMKQLGSTTPTARPALEAPAGDRPDYAAQAYDAKDADGVRTIYSAAVKAGHMTDELAAKLTEIGRTFASADGPAGQAAAATEDPDAVWQEVVSACPDTWTLDDLEARFAEQSGGLVVADAGAGEMRRFLDWLRTEAVSA